MSGHSKWAQIKRKKAVADQRRGRQFTKLAAAITVAARQGSDPALNPALRDAIEQARAANMPQDTIKRAIEKARQEKGAGILRQYEAYGPGGAALLISAVTDNSQRTLNDIRLILREHGGRLGEAGSVTWKFRQGQPVAPFPLGAAESAKVQKLIAALRALPEVKEVITDALLSS
jgi:YebC/PmpR family DNA-binding regulatory protein